MAAIWLYFFNCFLLIFTTHELHNSLKNKRQTEFHFYLALCFADWTGRPQNKIYSIYHFYSIDYKYNISLYVIWEISGNM